MQKLKNKNKAMRSVVWEVIMKSLADFIVDAVYCVADSGDMPASSLKCFQVYSTQSPQWTRSFHEHNLIYKRDATNRFEHFLG